MRVRGAYLARVTAKLGYESGSEPGVAEEKENVKTGGTISTGRTKGNRQNETAESGLGHCV